MKAYEEGFLKTSARNVGSRTTESVPATRGSTTQDGTDAIHGCCAMLFSFSWLDTERLSRACCDHKSSEYALSLCSVTFRGTLCAPRASFHRTYHHNQRVVCLRLCRQSVKHQPKEKLGLEQRSGATDFRSKGYRVSTCTFQQKFVSRLDHCRKLIIHHGITQTSSMFFPHPSLRHRPSVTSR